MSRFHIDNLSTYYMDTFLVYITCKQNIDMHYRKIIIQSITHIENLSIPHVDKIIFVYIEYGHFSIRDVEKIS